MKKLLILLLLPFYCFSQNSLNSNNTNIAKQAEIKFNSNVPTYLKLIKKYAVIQQQATFIGDVTNDGIDDILIWYNWGPKNDINHGSGIRLYKTINGKPVYILDFNPKYRFNIRGIQNNTLYITKLLYAKTDKRCCPSIKYNLQLKYTNTINSIEQRIPKINTPINFTLNNGNAVKLIPKYDYNSLINYGSIPIVILFIFGFVYIIKTQSKKYNIRKLEKIRIEEEKVILKELALEDTKRKVDEEYYKKVEIKRKTNLKNSQLAEKRKKEKIERAKQDEKLREKQSAKKQETLKKNRLEQEKKRKKEKEKLVAENKLKEIQKEKFEQEQKNIEDVLKKLKTTKIESHTKQTIENTFSYIKNKEPLNLNITKRVNYSTYKIIERTTQYPVVKKPKHNSIIRSFRPEGNKRKGYKEAEFMDDIQAVFEDDFHLFDNAMLAINTGTIPYEPDIAMISKSAKNIFIDIEIDEPYSGVNRKLTHCTPNDNLRDKFFTERGWIVIRFSEYQVHLQPMQCLYHIASIISSIDPLYKLPNELKYLEEIKNENCWNNSQAKYRESIKYRENYLNHTFAPYNEPYKPLNSSLTYKEIQEEKLVITQAIPQLKKIIPPPKRIYQTTYTVPKKTITQSNPIINNINNTNYSQVKQLIERAVKENKLIQISYTNWEGESSFRKISDIEYTENFMKNGYDYKVHFKGYCHKRKEERSFKISRINSIELIL